MTKTQIHEKRKVKNYVVFALLMLVVLSIFSLTIIKLHIADQNAIEVSKNPAQPNEEK